MNFKHAMLNAFPPLLIALASFAGPTAIWAWTHGKVAAPVSQLVITPSYDASVNNSPDAANFKAAVAEAIGIITSKLGRNVSITVKFYYDGTINGTNPLGTNPGGSLSNAWNPLPSYSEVRAAVAAQAKSALAIQAANSWPVSDPTPPGAVFSPGAAWGTCLALSTGAPSTPNGWVGLNPSKTWAWSQGGSIGPAELDAVGTLLHEITEIMGRFREYPLDTGLKGLDMYSYTGANARAFTQGANQFISFNNGTTLRYPFATAGDAGDWDQNVISNDSFNALQNPGSFNTWSQMDTDTMDAMCWQAL